MARFKFYLIGSCDTPVLELPCDNVRALNEVVTRNRFIEGQMDMGDGTCCGVLVPTGRIQLLVEES